jgi:tetratricopeptide (TPR) repeat protein
VLLRLALAHQELGEFDRALALFAQVRATSTGDPVFAAYLAQGYLAAARPAEALEIAERERAARPDDYRFTRLAADALARAGRVQEAVDLMQEAVNRLSQRPDVHLGLAALCVEQRRFDCAATALDRADRQFPGNVLVAFQRGAMFERQQRFEEAEREFREALVRDSRHGPSLNYLGYMLAERGERLDDAVSLLQRALATDPWNGSYLDSLGWAYYMRGDLDLSQKYLSLAAERLPLNSVVQDHLGDLLFKRGDRKGAIAAWERSLEGDRDLVQPDAISRKIDEARRVRP